MAVQVDIPKELRVRLRSYFQRAKAIHQRKYFKDILALMSPGLRSQFLHYTFAGTIDSETFLEDQRVQARAAQKRRRF